MILIKELKIGESFPVNEELAGLVPMAKEAEQVALTTSIRESGLKEPIVLWKGEVVDGRCRQIACTLSRVSIRARDLDDELTEEEVAVYVKAVNTRRNLTMGQKIIVAHKEHRKPGSKSVGLVAKDWGISKSILIMANYVAKHKPEFIEPLFNGGTVEIRDKTGVLVLTNKISAIHASIKRELEEVSTPDSYSWDANSHINTQAGKDWFFNFIKEKNIADMEVMRMLAERANYVFIAK